MTFTHNSRKRTITWAFATLSFLCIAFFIYDGIFKKAKEVNGGFVAHKGLFSTHKEPLWAVQFSPDGRLIASAGVDSIVKVQGVDSGQMIQTLKQPMGITSLDFSPDGKYIATAS